MSRAGSLAALVAIAASLPMLSSAQQSISVGGLSAVSTQQNITSPYFPFVTLGTTIVLDPQWTLADAVCCPQLTLYAGVGNSPNAVRVPDAVSDLGSSWVASTTCATDTRAGWGGGRMMRSTPKSCVGQTFVWTVPTTLTPGPYFFLASGSATSATGTTGVVASVAGVPANGAKGVTFYLIAPTMSVGQPAAQGVVDSLAAAADAAVQAAGAAASSPTSPTLTKVAWSNNVSACAFSHENPPNNPPILLNCSKFGAGSVIASIDYVNYGTFSGGCTNQGSLPPVAGRCSAAGTIGKLSAFCGPNAASCTVPTSLPRIRHALNNIFSDPCRGTYKRIVIYYTCAKSVQPPALDAPEPGYLTSAAVFGGDLADVQWASQFGEPMFEKVNLELRLDAPRPSSRALLATLAEGVEPTTSTVGGQKSFGSTFTFPMTLAGGWSYVASPPSAVAATAGATGRCIIRVKSTAFPTLASNDSAPFFCFPPLGMTISLATSAAATMPVPTVFSARKLGVSWTFANGMPAMYMGRPTVTLMLNFGSGASATSLPYGVIVSAASVAPAITNYTAPPIAYTSITWTVPSAAALLSGCAAAAAALPASLPAATVTAFLAACAPGPAPVWSVAVSMERRPKASFSSSAFAILDAEPLAIAPPQSAFSAGSTMSLSWPPGNIGSIYANVTLRGASSPLYAGYLNTPSVNNPTSLSLVLPLTRPAGTACDSSGAPTPGTATFASLADPTLVTSVAFRVAFPPTASLSVSPSSGALHPNSPWTVNWGSCGLPSGPFSILLGCPATGNSITLTTGRALSAAGFYTFTVTPALALSACTYNITLLAGSTAFSTAPGLTYTPPSASSTPTPSTTNTGTRTATPTGTGTPSTTSTKSGAPSSSATPTGTRTPTASTTTSRSNTPTPSITPSATPFGRISFITPAAAIGACAPGWTWGGQDATGVSQRCFKAFGASLDFWSASAACKSQGFTGNLASITTMSEFYLVQSMSSVSLGRDVWLGLYDSQSNELPITNGGQGFNRLGRHPCTARCQESNSVRAVSGNDDVFTTAKTNPVWKWTSNAPTTFLFSEKGQKMWNSAEPNNYNANTYTGVGGEYGVGFLGRGLNDWNLGRRFPYICEQLAINYFPGDFVNASWVGGLGASSISLIETPAAASAASRVRPASHVSAVNVSVPVGRSSPGTAMNVYIPCTIPPSSYTVTIKDYAGATYSSPSIVINPVLLVVNAPLPSTTTVFNNGSKVTLAWSAAPDKVLLRPELSTLSFALKCIAAGSNTLNTVPLGDVSTSSLRASLAVAPIANCGGVSGSSSSFNYVVVASIKGCAPEHGPFTFGPFAIAPEPESIVVLSPAAPVSDIRAQWDNAGGDMPGQPTTIAGVSACAAKCASTAGCAAWSVDTCSNPNRCWLKASVMPWSRNTCRTAGYGSPQHNWLPGTNLTVRFDYKGPALRSTGDTTVSVFAYSGTSAPGTKLTTLAPWMLASGFWDLGAFSRANPSLFPTMSTMTLRFVSSSSPTVFGDSRSLSIATPLSGIKVSSKNTTGIPTIFNDGPLVVSWSGTSSCPVTLTLIHSGVTRVTASSPSLTQASGSYAWTLPSNVYNISMAANFHVVVSVAACGSSAGQSGSSSPFAATTAFAARSPAMGVMLWPGQGLPITWSAENDISKAGLVTITVVASTSVVVATGVPAGTGMFTWVPTATQIRDLSSGQTYTPAYVIITATSPAGASLSAQIPTNPSARLVLMSRAPIAHISAPSANHTLEVGKPFLFEVLVGVPSANDAPLMSFAGVSNSKITLQSYAAIANSKPPVIAVLPSSYVPYLDLSFTLDLTYAGVTVQNLLSNASLYTPPTGLANGTPKEYMAVVTNATLGSCSFGRDFAAKVTVTSFGKVVPALTDFSDTFNVILPFDDVEITSPLPSEGSPILYAESVYNITWTVGGWLSSPACTNRRYRLDLELIPGSVPPTDGIEPQWGALSKAEVIVPGVLADAGTASWSFSSVDRTWWGNTPDTSPYWIALVTPDRSRRVAAYAGPFTLARSAIAIAPAPGSNPRLLRALYGSMITLPVTAVGFAGVESTFNVIAQNEPVSSVDNCAHWNVPSLISSSAIVLATSTPAALSDNTPHGPWAVQTLSWNVTAFPAGLPSPPVGMQTVIRVVETKSKVFSCSSAITSSLLSTEPISDAYDLWGGWGSEPTRPSSVRLVGEGALTLSVEFPVISIAITSAVAPTVVLSGSTVSMRISLSHTWVASRFANVAVALVKGTSSTPLTLEGCTPTFVPSTSTSLTTTTLECSAKLPTGAGPGYALVVTEGGSQVTSTSPQSLTVSPASLSWWTPPTVINMPVGVQSCTASAPGANCPSFCVSGTLPAGTTFALSITNPAGSAFALTSTGNSVAPVASSGVCGAGAVLYSVSLGLSANVPIALKGAPGLTLTITPSSSLVAPISGVPIFVGDPGAIKLTNIDPLGTTYDVRSILAGTKVVKLTASAPVSLANTLKSMNAVSRVQVHCPGYAKAGWGWTNPYWAWISSWRSYNWGLPHLWSLNWARWGWWSPWFFRSQVWDYRCWSVGAAMTNPACANSVQAQVAALFLDKSTASYEMVVTTVAQIAWGSITIPGSSAIFSSTFDLGIAAVWDDISFTNGACYFKTNTSAPGAGFVPLPASASGRAVCIGSGASAVCHELVEGEWGNDASVYFKGMFSMAPPTKTFPLSVALPAKNGNGAFLTSGDVAVLTVDLRGLSSPPASVDLELRADGFRGNALVGSHGAPINLQGNKFFRMGAIPDITPFTDRGADGVTYANWGEANSEGTAFSFRLYDSEWRKSWVYANSPSFAFCDWPAIDSVRLRRLYWGDMWLQGYTQSYDPTRPFVSWQPLASLGDSTAVDIRQYNVGDWMRVRAFGIQCMTGVNFTLVSYDAPSGVATPLQPLCRNIRVDSYTGTVNCDFYLQQSALGAQRGSAYAVVATGADGRGLEMSQFFAVLCPSCILASKPAPPASATPSTTPSASFSGTSTPSGTPSNSLSSSITPSTTKTGSVTPTSTPTGTPSTTNSLSATPTVSDSNTRSGTGTGTGTSSGTGTPTTTVSASKTPSSTNSASGTPPVTPSMTGTTSGTGTPTGTSTPCGTQTLTATPTQTPSSSITPSGTPTTTITTSGTPTTTISVTPTSTVTPTASITATSTGSDTGSVTPTPTGTGTPSSSTTSTPSVSSTPSSTPSASATSSPSQSDTPSSSPTGTGTPTTTVTGSPSISNSASSSETATPTPTETPTTTVSAAASPSTTSTLSSTPSSSTSMSSTPSNSDTPSSSLSGTPSNSPTASSSFIPPVPSSTPKVVSFPAPIDIRVFSPAAGDSWMVGQPTPAIVWSTTRTTDTFSIDLYQLQNLGGSLGSTVVFVNNLGQFKASARAASVVLPLVLSNVAVPPAGTAWGSNFFITITSITNPSQSVQSPSAGSFFTILDVPSIPLMQITSPSVGASWVFGAPSVTVSWVIPGDGSEIAAVTGDPNGDGNPPATISFGTITPGIGGAAPTFKQLVILADGVGCVERPDLGVEGVSSVTVPVPNLPAGNNYYVQISFYSSPLVIVYSPVILLGPALPPATISVSAPAPATTCILGATCTTAWTAVSVPTFVNVALSYTNSAGATASFGSVAVAAAAGIYAFPLPYSTPAGFPDISTTNFWFTLTSAADGTTTGTSPLFRIAAPAPVAASPTPAPPTLSVSTPGAVDTWIVDRSSVSANSTFLVSWVGTNLPSTATISIALAYRPTTSTSATSLGSSSFTMAFISAGVNASLGSVAVAIPVSVPVPMPGSSSSSNYAYKIVITNEQDATIASSGDVFSIVLSANSVLGGGAAPPPVASASPSSEPAPVGDSASASPSSAPAPPPIVSPTPPAPTPAPLQVNLIVSAPLPGAVVLVGSTLKVSYSLNASAPVAYTASSITLIRKLPSGDAIEVAILKGTGAGSPVAGSSRRRLQAAAVTYDTTPLNPATPEWEWSASTTATAGMLLTSGYAMRVSFTTPAGAVVYADSGSFTLAVLPTLTVTSPVSGATFTAGDVMMIKWTSTSLDGSSVSISVKDPETGAIISPPVVNSMSVSAGEWATAPVSSGSFAWNTSTSWGASTPLLITVASLARPDITASSPGLGFSVIAVPRFVQVTSTTPSSPVMIIGSAATVNVVWKTQGVGSDVTVDLMCVPVSGGSYSIVESVSSASTSYTWSFANDIAGLTVASQCFINVKATSSPLVFAASSTFGVAPRAVPSLILTAPALSSSLALTAAAGDALPLSWTSTSAAGMLFMTLYAQGVASFSAPPLSFSIADVSTGALPSFLLPLSTPTGGYSVVFSALAAASTSTARVNLTSPFSLTVIAPSFAFTSPSVGAIVRAGEPLTISWTTSSSALRSCSAPASGMSIDLYTAGVSKGLPQLVANVFTGESACSGSFVAPIPASTFAGDYFFVATATVPSELPSLNALSPAFTIVPPPVAPSINIVSPTAGAAIVAGGVLNVWFNASGFALVTQFDVTLFQCKGALSAACDQTVLTRAIENVAVYSWPIPTRINGMSAWDGSLTSFVAVSWSPAGSVFTSFVSNSTVGFSSGFSITPAPPNVIANVSMSPDPTLLTGSLINFNVVPSIALHWTALSGSSTLYNIELWQERYYYTGGDALVYNVTGTGPVPALAGAVSYLWADLPQNLVSTEPYYVRIVAVAGPYVGVWGRSSTFYVLSAPLPTLSSFLASECASADLDALNNKALCATDCSACEGAGGVWATGSTVSLSYFISDSTTAALPMGTTELARLSATLGAFKQWTPVCLPAYATTGNAATAIAIPLGPLAMVGAKVATLYSPAPVISANLVVVAADTSATCANILPMVSLTVEVSSSNAAAAASALAAQLAAASNLPPSDFSVSLTSGTASSGTAGSRRMQAVSLQAGGPSFRAPGLVVGGMPVTSVRFEIPAGEGRARALAAATTTLSFDINVPVSSWSAAQNLMAALQANFPAGTQHGRMLAAVETPVITHASATTQQQQTTAAGASTPSEPLNAAAIENRPTSGVGSDSLTTTAYTDNGSLSFRLKALASKALQTIKAAFKNLKRAFNALAAYLGITPGELSAACIFGGLFLFVVVFTLAYRYCEGARRAAWMRGVAAGSIIVPGMPSNAMGMFKRQHSSHLNPLHLGQQTDAYGSPTKGGVDGAAALDRAATVASIPDRVPWWGLGPLREQTQDPFGPVRVAAHIAKFFGPTIDEYFPRRTPAVTSVPSASHVGASTRWAASPTVARSRVSNVLTAAPTGNEVSPLPGAVY